MTRTLLAKEGNLAALVRTPEYRRSNGLPTWVPDWCAEVDEDRIDQELAWLKYYYRYSTALGTRVRTRPSGSDSLLDLQGVIVDRVSEIGALCDDRRYYTRASSQWRDTVGRIGQLHEQCYPGGGTYDDVFWRLVLADSILVPKPNGFVDFRRCRPGDKEVYNGLVSKGGSTNQEDYLSGRMLFVTEKGYIGLGGPEVTVGDVVAVFYGGNMPFVLRPLIAQKGRSMQYEYVGQSYIHGIMDGEMLRGDDDFQWITLC
ncbi:uncharacterized protein JN550_003697 [Neoarthrinium moseri]|uniref:uncharacterized protein n=1 Tax=Neoarthrinium moseri TaxID=1658444 RepID=UPI001FDD863A|nr:uncharacterized protein JN550_003697 [Neoarthrinium moseri]KAI1872823.1 hypothetical protein JN550_003697 [Neoarthrinium moseri]